MEVVNSRHSALPKGSDKGCAVALGYFDGIHLGHRQVIGAAVEFARQQKLCPAVFTFTMAAGASPKGQALMTPPQKHRILEELGVQYCFEPPFEAFRALAPEAFFNEMLLGEYRARALFCGQDFAFGARRAGNVALLQALCAQQNIALQVLPTTLLQGAAVSSSRIRAAVANGDMEQAAAMLGRPYEIELPVQHGHSLGRTLGFPTLNQVFPSGMQRPKQGVYITRAVVGERSYPAATGYGNRPTVNGDALTCETFIPGFSGDLYGKNVRVQFFSHIADTTRFESPRQLARAVQGWASRAIDYFAADGAG